MRSLGSLLRQVVAPVPAIDSTITAIGWCVSVLVAGGIAGVRLGVAEGVAVGLGVALLLALRAGWALQRGRDEAAKTHPQLEISRPGVSRNKALYRDGVQEGEGFEVAVVIGANKTFSREPEADARNVRALVAYYGANDEQVATSFGRWADTDEPLSRPHGRSIEDLHEVTIRANHVPRALEVAIRYHGDSTFSTFANANYETIRVTGQGDLRGKALPNPTKVRVTMAGSGVQSESKEFLLRLKDGRLDFAEIA